MGGPRTALPGSGREQALRYAAAREAAFDPRRVVLVHGDAHPFNLLQVPGHAGGFRLIDPEGVAAEPALELGVMMRNLKDGLADREPAEARMIMTRHCQHAGRFAGADPEVIPTSPHSPTTICRSSPPALRGLRRLRRTLASSHA